MREKVEVNVKKILKKDGIKNNVFNQENKLNTNIKKIIDSKLNKKNWSYRLVNTKSNSATLISQQPGEGNRRHYHSNWDEWWLIIKGMWKFEIEGKEFKLKKNDLILIKRKQKHKITAIGKTNAIRLAVSRGDVDHIYVD